MKLRRRASSTQQLPAEFDDDAPMSARVLSQVIERSTRAQAPAVKAYVARLRRLHPEATPADIVVKLEKRYLAAVMASGAAVGSASAVPGIGTLAALSAVAGETVIFLETTAVFVLAVADVYGIPVDERERRRTLVLTVLVGEESKGAVAGLLGPGRTAGVWLTEGAGEVPLSALAQINSRLMRYFVKRFTVKRGALMFGKMLPVGIGALIGGGGNRFMGKKIVRNARMAFGPAPTRWPATLHLLPRLENSAISE